jgi:hypothetical protein
MTAAGTRYEDIWALTDLLEVYGGACCLNLPSSTARDANRPAIDDEKACSESLKLISIV